MAELGGIATQPAFIAQYGRPKLGKTSDDLFSFPRAFFIAAPGALKPSLGLVGYEPKKQFYVEMIREATALVEAAPKGKFDACVIDDFSLLVERTVAALERQGAKGYDLWGLVYKQALRLREVARACGIHVVLNAHEAPPGTTDGTFWMGSMALPGKKLPYSIPAACDLVLRAAPAEDVEIGWPVKYLCDPSHTDWITGDRHNVTPVSSPMNLGEILRLVGKVGGNPSFAPRRLEGLEWQEVLVEKGANAIVEHGVSDIDFAKSTLRMVMDRAMSKHTSDERHALWAVRDTWDRAVLTAGLSAHRRKFYQF